VINKATKATSTTSGSTDIDQSNLNRSDDSSMSSDGDEIDGEFNKALQYFMLLVSLYHKLKQAQHLLHCDELIPDQKQPYHLEVSFRSRIQSLAKTMIYNVKRYPIEYHIILVLWLLKTV
jgi:hypothetical protein